MVQLGKSDFWHKVDPNGTYGRTEITPLSCPVTATHRYTSILTQIMCSEFLKIWTLGSHIIKTQVNLKNKNETPQNKTKNPKRN